MEAKINFGEASSGSGEYEVFPEGTYKIRIKDWKDVISSKGTQQIRWWGIIEGPEEYNGKSLTQHTPLSEAALFRVANLVKGCGINVADLPTMIVMGDAFRALLNQCKGRTTYWRISKDSEYNNNKVQECIIDEDQPIVEPVTFTKEMGGESVAPF